MFPVLEMYFFDFEIKHGYWLLISCQDVFQAEDHDLFLEIACLLMI